MSSVWLESSACCKIILMRNSKLGLLACHLNAPVGPWVEPQHIARALREGSVVNVHAGGRTDAVRGLLLTLFIEADPALILGCAREAGADLQGVNRLYEEAIHDHLPRVKDWERLVAART